MPSSGRILLKRYLLKIATDADREKRNIATGGHGLIHKASVDDFFILCEIYWTAVTAGKIFRTCLKFFIFFSSFLFGYGRSFGVHTWYGDPLSSDFRKTRRFRILWAEADTRAFDWVEATASCFLDLVLSSQSIEFCICRYVTKYIDKLLFASIVIFASDRAQVFLLATLTVHCCPIV